MKIQKEHIAPCGINCTLCYAFQREKNKCEGCRGDEAAKPNSCRNCFTTACEALRKNDTGFCYACETFPCKRLKALDYRYRKKYNISVLKNLESIQNEGIEPFLAQEQNRWACANCGELVCIHEGKCNHCEALF